MTTVSEVKARAAASPNSRLWFSPGAMAWFSCRVIPTVIDLGGGESLFLTSDVFGETEAARVFNLRHQDGNGDITTILESMPNDLALAKRVLRTVGAAMKAGDLYGPIPYGTTPEAFAARAMHEFSG